MRFLSALGLLALVLACSGGKDDGAADPDDTDLDEAPEFEGDDAGECDDGADNDRDGDFDCEDSDCRDAPGCEEEEPENVVYEGSVVGETGSAKGLSCEGSFWIEVQPDGSALGDADCLFDAGFDFEGTIDGEVDGTRFVGVWDTPMFGAIDLEGDATGSVFRVDFEAVVESGRFSGTFEGRP
jgi:hypothetical protein